MEYILEVVTFYRLLCIEKFKKFLDKLGSHVNFQRTDFYGFINNELQEKLINTLNVRPGRVDLFLLLYSCLRKLKIRLLYIRQRSEYVLFDHGHDVVEVRND